MKLLCTQSKHTQRFSLILFCDKKVRRGLFLLYNKLDKWTVAKYNTYNIIVHKKDVLCIRSCIE